MDIPSNTAQLSPKRLHKVLEENYKKFKAFLPPFPLKASEISSKFSDFFKKNLAAIRLFYSSELSFPKDQTDEDIESTFSLNICDRAIQENFCMIYEALLKNQKDFADLIIFEKVVDFQLLMDFLKYMKVSEDFSLKPLKDEKDVLLKNNENMKSLKEIMKMEEKNSKDKTFLVIVEAMSEPLANFYTFLLKYFEKVFEGFEYMEEFKIKFQEISAKLSKFFDKLFKKKEPMLYNLFNVNVSQLFDNIMLILTENLTNLKENNPKLCVMALKEFRQQAIILLKKACKDDFYFIPSELLIYRKIVEINTKIYQKFYEKCLDFEKNQSKTLEALETRLLPNILDYFLKKLMPFSQLNENEKNLLFILIISSLFGQKLTEKQFIDNMEYFFDLEKRYFPQKPSQELENLLSNISDLETCQENLLNIKNSKETAINQWSDKISEKTNLHVIFSLVLDLEKIKPFEEKEKINHIKVEIFLTNSHEKIKIILRNMQDYAHGYSNWDVLTLIEHMISRLMCPFENEELLKIKIENKELYEKIKKNFKFQSFHTGSDEVLKDIRNVDLENLEKKMNFLMKRVEDIQEKKECLSPPKKFQFEKLSKIETRSRIINICISGFLSQESNKRKEWADLIDVCDRKNMELISLKWLSSTEDTLLQFFSKSYTDLVSLKGISSYLPIFGLAKMMIENPFLETLGEAQKTGFYLAHLIGDLEIFGNCAINLIGFSMGTIVIFECIQELKKMGKVNVIHDVIVMGGIINREEMKSLQLNMINGKWIHCYSKKDWALKFLFRLAKFGENAIGSKRLEGDKKIVNFDCSDFVDGHLQYRGKMSEIFLRIDFLKDHNYLLEDLETNYI